ncbi:potassium-transporting ATPase subunit KdpA [Cytophagaceae bacterium 50C-KIRBA]|uniref:Potassium-transporting ATPase potassium-binding subunit n=1 Tax=Aquirufa beregesia TaxID=2516556 RepID=A0ABX0EUC7_9BACT|nr:potassium-transporting ATPase subunit KdpA [Aquirufa beregesia]NGZ43648.1 potassium-transporting ATPase subunit KdpA [Aquirufa beregesia]
MNTEIIGVILSFLVVVILAKPMGRYMGKIFSDEKTNLDFLFDPLDKLIYKLGNIDFKKEMNWKQHIVVMLTINLVWFVLAMLVLTNMGNLALNPDGNPSMSLDLALNTAISFIANTNLQHYSGETGISYLGQLVLMLFQFISAGCGIAMAVIVVNAMKEKVAHTLGNFYYLFVRSCTRILLPFSILVAILLVLNGSPMTFEGKDTITTLQDESVQVSRGPAAAFIAIKHLGTNGGGFFGANSSHPLENPNYFTNTLEIITQMLIPLAFIFAIGYMLKRKNLAWMIFGVMTVGFLLLALPTIWNEMNGNPLIEKMGINQHGNMEGKEVRFGAAASAYWSIATTVISTGSVNAMHDSFMPLSGLFQMLGMMVNAFYGGCGVGFLNFYIYIILTVFISGLMVGRTPEFLGKKIEAKEMQIAMGVTLLHPLLILTGTAFASYAYTQNPIELSAWLNNPSFHGFSEMLYEFTSSSANNGSGFEGLGDNTPFWNIASGIVMLLARFIPIIGPVAIAGSLASKKYIPESAGTLKTDTITFGLMIFIVIVIVAALSFFPALSLGPIAEYLSM